MILNRDSCSGSGEEQDVLNQSNNDTRIHLHRVTAYKMSGFAITNGCNKARYFRLMDWRSQYYIIENGL
jgi:hypothetical protein